MKCLIILSIFVVAGVAREGFGPGEQEWGYVTVRPKAHMFWWLYLTTANVNNVTERPLVIWLQGGPGASSTAHGNFEELRPIDVNNNPRNHTWVKDVNVLFVDNPVGTGFSYTESSVHLTKTNKQIADDFVEFLRGFYKAQPIFKSVPLYITSQSYGGKMAAEIGLLLDQEIKKGTIECILKGVLLGDAWVSPIDSVLNWAPYLYNIGAVDQSGHDLIATGAQKCKSALDNGEFVQATDEWENTEYTIMAVSEDVDFYNVLTKITAWRNNDHRPVFSDVGHIAKPGEASTLAAIGLRSLMNGPVKKALNLNVTWGAQKREVFNYLREDFMKPVTDIVELLLNTTDISVYVSNGQLDLIVDTPGTVQWVDRLNWLGTPKWPTVTRRPLVVKGINEGYVKSLGKLALYWINRAGHMVPEDNPAAMDGILRSLTKSYTVHN